MDIVCFPEGLLPPAAMSCGCDTEAAAGSAKGRLRAAQARVLTMNYGLGDWTLTATFRRYRMGQQEDN